MNAGKAVLGAIAALILLAAIVLGGWQAGWWFKTQNIDRQYHVNVHSQQYQGAQIDRLRNDVQGYDVAMDQAQKAQIRMEFCAVFPELTQPPADLVSAAVRLGC